MATIQDYLNKIKTAIYGKDVRQAIYDAIHQCYEDGKAGDIDLTAREDIASLTTLVEEIQSTGIGGIPVVASDLNEKADTGWWVIGESTLNAPSDITLGVCQVIRRTSAQVIQIATSTIGIRAIRTASNYPNSWGIWRYENPSLNSNNVEYPLNKRFNGSWVYAKKLVTGVSSSLSTNITNVLSSDFFNIKNFKRVIRIDGELSNINGDIRYPLPYVNTGDGKANFSVNVGSDGLLRIETNFNSDKNFEGASPGSSHIDLYIIIYYTK